MWPGLKSSSENAGQPCHVFTSIEGVSVKVYKECACGVCTCKYELGGEIAQLKPYCFAKLLSLGTVKRPMTP